MSFYIRKSIKVGPMRFNISKSGIGASFGVTGARISTGPRGSYIHMGRQGLYYRQKIDGSMPLKEDEITDIRNGAIDQQDDSEDLITSTSNELTKQINERIQHKSNALMIFFIFTIISIIFLFTMSVLLAAYWGSYTRLFMPIIFLFTIFIFSFGVYLTRNTRKQDELSRFTTLNYKLDEATIRNYEILSKGFGILSRSRNIWRIISHENTSNWRRNAGATFLLDRREVFIRQMPPPFLKVNVRVFCIQLGSTNLYFLPDQIFVYQNEAYSTIGYQPFHVETSSTRFIEENYLPEDATVIDYTWKYVRKNGEPDKRFRDNRRLPIMEYGNIHLLSPAGLDLQILVSSKDNAGAFAGTLRNYFLNLNLPEEETHKEDEFKQEQAKSSSVEINKLYTLIGVPLNSPLEEVTQAYHKLAQKYHPDKVASLAPEFQELAEKRMKELNNAYESIKKHIEE